MKAQKAVGGFFAVSVAAAALLSRTGFIAECADAAETPQYAGFSVERTGADKDGVFTVDVYLDNVPESGLAAVDFAIAYDPAAVTVSNVTLLYDTGADAAEAAMDPKLKGTVFTYEKTEGELQIRWATVLDREYWLKENRAFFSVRGKVNTDAVEPGSKTDLRITPAHREGAGGQPTVTAGYMDEKGTPVTFETRLSDGAVWMPVNDEGATMYGDVDLDGTLSVADAVLLGRAVAEDKALCAAAYANADCEFDGELTITDVTLILQVLSDEADAAALGAH
jgi:hypothetical protein